MSDLNKFFTTDSFSDSVFILGDEFPVLGLFVEFSLDDCEFLACSAMDARPREFCSRFVEIQIEFKIVLMDAEKIKFIIIISNEEERPEK